jgi:hypothetical protein|tara:strand:- start:624 stop:1034 length:411 start_codon:yes stop_codon:yes gene_type:complete
MFCIEGRHAKPEIVEEYVVRLMQALKIHRFTSKLITVQFKSELTNYAQGLCEGDKDYATIQIGKFDQTFLQQMQALAHEMVHARQFLRGQLSAVGVWKWKGRNADNYAYTNQPWEKEAYRLERELFLDCFPFEKMV